MSSLQFEYIGDTQFRLDMRWLTDVIGQYDHLSDIEKHKIQLGNKKVAVAELFKVSGSTSATSIRLEGTHADMDYIGYALPANVELTTSGPCGQFTGAELHGGRLICEQGSGDFTGCAMHSGIIDVKENCGDFTGSAYSGRQRGMRGGTILIRGNSGKHTGDLMRRGTILVEGDIGDYAASRMIAGTIANLGAVGNHIAMGMKRGTLLLPSLPITGIPTNFVEAGRHNLGFLTLLLNEVRQHDSRFKTFHPMRRRVLRLIGDRTCNGLGEILVWVGGVKFD